MALVLLIAGIACVLYGLAVMAIWSGTWFFAFWHVLGLVLIGGAWALHAGAWDSLPATARHAACALVGAALVGFLVTQGLIMKDFSGRGEEGADYLVVLGAQVYEGRPSVILARRLDAACDYLERNPDTKCVVSGGQGANEPATEASVMASYLLEHGIEADRVILEERARNTHENIAYSSELFDSRSDHVAIVTSDFHLFRSLGIARKNGFEHVSGIAAPSAPFYLPNNMVRESFGIAKDYLVGNL